MHADFPQRLHKRIILPFSDSFCLFSLVHFFSFFSPLFFSLLTSPNRVSPLPLSSPSKHASCFSKTCQHNTCLARNIQIQQLLQPVDPSSLPSLARARPDSEGDQDGPQASVLQRSSTGNPPRGAADRPATCFVPFEHPTNPLVFF